MDVSTHAVQQILSQVDKAPSSSGPWRQLMLLCFDQKDIETFQTLQIVIDGLDKLLEAKKRQAKREFSETQKTMQESGVQTKTRVREPNVTYVELSELQRQFFCKLARSPSSPGLLQKIGGFYLNNWNLPEVAQKHFERALNFEPEDPGIMERLAEAMAALARVGTMREAPEPMVSPGQDVVSVPTTSMGAPELIRKSGRISIEPTQSISKKHLSSSAMPTGSQPLDQGVFKTANIDTLNRQMQLLQTKIESMEQHQASQAIIPGPASNKADEDQQDPDEETTSLPRKANAALNRSLSAMQQGHLDEAAAEARAAVELHPQVETGWQAFATLGLAYFNEGRFEEAVRSYKDALRIEPKAVESWFNLGVTFFELGKTEDALRCYLQANALDPNNSKICCNLGAVYFESGQYEQAEIYFRRAIQIRPDYAHAWDNLGATLAVQHKLQDAAEACRRAIELKPEGVDAWFKLGSILFQQEKNKESAEAFSKVIELRPDFALAHGQVAILHAREGHLKEAKEACKKMEFIGVEPEMAAPAWNALAAAYCIVNRYDEAIAAGQHAVELQPKDANIWINLGLAQFRKGVVAEAERSYFNAVQLDQTSSEACYSLGVTRYTLGRYAEATEAFSRAAELTPNSAEVWFDLSTSLQMENKAQEAIFALKKVIDLEPNHPLAWANIGALYMHQRDLTSALEALKRAAEEPSPAGTVFYDLASCYEAIDNLDMAIQNYEKATAVSADRPEFWHSLGTALQKAGQEQKAFAAFRRSLDQSLQ
jgi:tetratricopeptide (TPR) repeat protein